jgi:G3E family GTPase
MSKSSRAPIPVNVIAGSLGVGKTTTINHLLKQRPPDERWAVLVNEYGLIGLDAALMEGSDAGNGPAGVEIREVAGGCICCSAGVMFEMSLVLLLRRRPDRLLIEPTGLAALSGILDTLDRPGIRPSVDVQSIVCLLDPARLDEVLLREEVRDQVEAADVLLASLSDLASEDQLHAFDSWANGLFPAKSFVGPVERGRMPSELLHLVSDRDGPVRRRGHRHEADESHHHAHEASHHADEHSVHSLDIESGVSCDETRPIVQQAHHSSVASTIGWVCWAGWIFDAALVTSWLRDVASLPGARRAKAVLRTTDGWLSYNLADGVEEFRPSGYRRDSRIEVIVEGAEPPDADGLERQLRACLTPREQ